MENNQSPVFPFAFVKWYSGMQDHQIEDAWKRYQKEVPSTDKGETATGEGEIAKSFEAHRNKLHATMERIGMSKEYIKGHSQGYADAFNEWFTPPKGIDTEQSAKGGKSLEECKDEVAKRNGYFSWDKDSSFENRIDFINEIVELYASQQQQAGWIAASERLPELGRTIVICFENGSMLLIEYKRHEKEQWFKYYKYIDKPYTEPFYCEKGDLNNEDSMCKSQCSDCKKDRLSSPPTP